MGAVKEMWMAEVEAAQERLDEDHDDEAFSATMRGLGFDRDEVADHLAAAREGQGRCPACGFEYVCHTEAVRYCPECRWTD